MSTTKRRSERDAGLLAEWAGTPPGQRVTVQRANGEELKTILLYGPFSQDGRGAYVRVEGIAGNTALHRVSRGWNPSGERIYLKNIRKGLRVRRGGNPRTEIGRLRKDQIFEVADVYGRPGHGYCDVLLRGDGGGFRVNAVTLVKKWEQA